MNELGRPQEAEIHFKEAIRLRPWDADLRNNLGVALLGQGKFSEAEIQFEEVLRLKPDHRVAAYLLSSVRKRLIPPMLHP